VMSGAGNVPSAPASSLAATLFSRLSGGARSPQVPLRFWRSQYRNGDRTLPSRIPLHQAARNVVVVVVDQMFFPHRTEWSGCINALISDADSKHDLILPVSVQSDAALVSPAFRDVNHLVAENPDQLGADERILQSIYTALLRQLPEDLPSVFLCHAKA